MRKNKKLLYVVVVLVVIFCCMIFYILFNVILNLKQDRNVERIYGTDRYKTSINVSKKTFNRSKIVIIASGDGYADALSASQLSVAMKAPILLNPSSKVDLDVLNEIHRLKCKEIIIIGGERSISPEVENEFRKVADVFRVSGRTRYDTSYKIMRLAEKHGDFNKIVFVSGKSFPDAMSAVNIVKKKKALMLLTDGYWIPRVSLDKELYIIGDKKQMPLNGIVGLRISDIDRYRTSLKVARLCYKNPKKLILVNGKNFPDAMSAVALVSKLDIPIVLIKEDSLIQGVEQYIVNNVNNIFVVGGESSISSRLLQILRNPNLSYKYTDNKIPQKNRTKNITIKNIDVLYKGNTVNSGIKYPSGTIKGIYEFTNNLGQLVFVVKNPSEQDYEHVYSRPDIWYCTSSSEPKLIDSVGSFDCTVRKFNINDNIGKFIGLSIEKNAGGSGSQSELFGVAVDSNGRYLYGPYKPKDDGPDSFIEIKGNEKKLEGGYGFSYDGSLKYGDYDTCDNIEQYSKKSIGSYAAYGSLDYGHYWEVKRVGLIKSANSKGFDVQALGASNKTETVKAGSFGNGVFTDDLGLIKIDLSDEFIKHMGVYRYSFIGDARMYTFYNKRERASILRREGERSRKWAGYYGSLGIIESSKFKTAFEDHPMYVPIGRAIKDNISYTVFYSVSGDDGPGGETEEEESYYEKWHNEEHEILRRIRPINNTQYIPDNKAVAELCGSTY